jgi:hypothetical protein
LAWIASISVGGALNQRVFDQSLAVAEKFESTLDALTL